MRRNRFRKGGGTGKKVECVRRPVDKPNPVFSDTRLRERQRRQPFLLCDLPYPSFRLSEQLFFMTRCRTMKTGFTRSCTGRGFSAPRSLARLGVPYGTDVITDAAVVSYTTFSPVSIIPASRKRGMCVFCDTVRSCGVWPARPSLASVFQRLTRGTLPCGVRTFLPDAVAPGRLPDRPAYASGCPGAGAFTSHSEDSVHGRSIALAQRIGSRCPRSPVRPRPRSLREGYGEFQIHTTPAEPETGPDLRMPSASRL